MGCSESKPEEHAQEASKSDLTQNHAVSKSRNDENNCPLPVAQPVEVKTHKSINEPTLDSDTVINATGNSWEVITTKKEKPRSTSIKSNHRRLSQRTKPKELSQVQPAWGRKSTTIENSFLEDLRLLREKAEKNVHYEKGYDAVGEDKSSRFITKADGNQSVVELESSHSGLLDTLSADDVSGLVGIIYITSAQTWS